MLRILIVDDEPWARAELKMLLGERPDVRVVGEADSVAATLAQLRALRPDLMFLDIHLRGESGFDVFEQADVHSEVVFLTAYEEHALRAFDVNALDYLVKPLRPEHLDRALDRAFARPRPRESERTNDGAPTPRLFLKESNALRGLLVSEIAYVQGAEAYTEAHLVDGRIVLVKDRLHRWEHRLGAGFVRIHRSTLVNASLIESLAARRGRWQVTLRGVRAPLDVSRRLLRGVRERLEGTPPSAPPR